MSNHNGEPIPEPGLRTYIMGSSAAPFAPYGAVDENELSRDAHMRAAERLAEWLTRCQLPVLVHPAEIIINPSHVYVRDSVRPLVLVKIAIEVLNADGTRCTQNGIEPQLGGDRRETP